MHDNSSSENCSLSQEAQLEALEQLRLSPAGLTTHQWAELIIFYMIEGDLINAKFTWKNVPKTSRDEEPILNDVWYIGRALILYSHGDAFATIKNTKWPQWIKPLIERLYDVLVERCMHLVGKVYTCITTQGLCSLIGSTKDEAKTLVDKYGWSIDVASDAIFPKQITAKIRGKSGMAGKIPQLTDYVSFLEC